MKNHSVFLLTLIFIATVMLGCERASLVDKPVADQNKAIAKEKSIQISLREQLVTGLGGGWGSTIGPGGDLFVPDGKAGAILRVDPKTGDFSTFASGLPQLIPGVGIGGISDVAFYGEKAYALLRDTLEKAGKAGIASVVIRTKQYLAALVAQDELLVLNTLRYADELKDPAELEIPKAKVTAKELDMAMRLVDDMADQWHPDKYKDTYKDDLLKRIKEKVKAGETEEITEPEKEARKEKGADVIDLMSLLRKSVEQKPKPAKRSARKRRAA